MESQKKFQVTPPPSPVKQITSLGMGGLFVLCEDGSVWEGSYECDLSTEPFKNKWLWRVVISHAHVLDQLELRLDENLAEIECE